MPLLPAALALLAACLPSPVSPTVSPQMAPQMARPPGWVLPLRAPTVVLREFAPPPPTAPWQPGHRGVDLAADPGAVVQADGPGVVVFAAPVARLGVVVVDHGGGLRSTFEPVRPSLPAGSVVRAGDVVGHLGAWWVDPGVGSGPSGLGGHCRGRPCLHWGMLRGGQYVDPLVLTGRVALCRQVRLLPPVGTIAAPGARPGAGDVAAAVRSGAPAISGPPRSASGPGAWAEASLVAAGVAVPVAVAGRRRRRGLGSAGADP